MEHGKYHVTVTGSQRCDRSHRMVMSYIVTSHSHSIWQRSPLTSMRTVGDKVHSHDSNCIYSVVKSNGNSIEFSLSIAEQRVVGFILAWSLASLQPQLMYYVSICCHVCGCIFQEDWIVARMSSTGAEQEWSGPDWSGIFPEWMGFDNKIGTTLASARALCLDLLSRVWLHISGGLNCCQKFWRGMV